MKKVLVVAAVTTSMVAGCTTVTMDMGQVKRTTNLSTGVMTDVDEFSGTADYYHSGQPRFGCRVKEDSLQYYFSDVSYSKPVIAPSVDVVMKLKMTDGSFIDLKGVSRNYNEMRFKGTKDVINQIMATGEGEYMYRIHSSYKLVSQGNFSIDSGMMSMRTKEIGNVLDLCKSFE